MLKWTAHRQKIRRSCWASLGFLSSGFRHREIDQLDQIFPRPVFLFTGKNIQPDQGLVEIGAVIAPAPPALILGAINRQLLKDVHRCVLSNRRRWLKYVEAYRSERLIRSSLDCK